jgi:hypothetical protein
LGYEALIHRRDRPEEGAHSPEESLPDPASAKLLDGLFDPVIHVDARDRATRDGLSVNHLIEFLESIGVEDGLDVLWRVYL